MDYKTDYFVYSFQAGDANRYGVNGAILLDYLKRSCERHYWNNWNIYKCSDGKERAWIQNRKTAWTSLFPFWTESQIRRILDKLEESGAIEKGNFNEDSFDQTSWYTVL